jgi:hypothetical protein
VNREWSDGVENGHDLRQIRARTSLICIVPSSASQKQHRQWELESRTIGNRKSTLVLPGTLLANRRLTSASVSPSLGYRYGRSRHAVLETKNAICF